MTSSSDRPSRCAIEFPTPMPPWPPHRRGNCGQLLLKTDAPTLVSGSAAGHTLACEKGWPIVGSLPWSPVTMKVSLVDRATKKTRLPTASPSALSPIPQASRTACRSNRAVTKETVSTAQWRVYGATALSCSASTLKLPEPTPSREYRRPLRYAPSGLEVPSLHRHYQPEQRSAVDADLVGVEIAARAWLGIACRSGTRDTSRPGWAWAFIAQELCRHSEVVHEQVHLACP